MYASETGLQVNFTSTTAKVGDRIDVPFTITNATGQPIYNVEITTAGLSAAPNSDLSVIVTYPDVKKIGYLDNGGQTFSAQWQYLIRPDSPASYDFTVTAIQADGSLIYNTVTVDDTDDGESVLDIQGPGLTVQFSPATVMLGELEAATTVNVTATITNNDNRSDPAIITMIEEASGNAVQLNPNNPNATEIQIGTGETHIVQYDVENATVPGFNTELTITADIAQADDPNNIWPLTYDFDTFVNVQREVVPDGPDLSIAYDTTTIRPFYPGSSVEIPVIVKNEGDLSVADGTVTLFVPPGMDATDYDGGTYNMQDNTITWAREDDTLPVISRYTPIRLRPRFTVTATAGETLQLTTITSTSAMETNYNNNVVIYEDIVPVSFPTSILVEFPEDNKVFGDSQDVLNVNITFLDANNQPVSAAGTVAVNDNRDDSLTFTSTERFTTDVNTGPHTLTITADDSYPGLKTLTVYTDESVRRLTRQFNVQVLPVPVTMPEEIVTNPGQSVRIPVTVTNT
ncbi:MAG: hypothetical protein AAFR22_23535, partial [Chloroflexota bacterium]